MSNNVVRRLWAKLSSRRRRQSVLVLSLMLVGAMAEVVSLGAVLPFLAVLADPTRILEHPSLRPGLEAIGLSEPGPLLVTCALLFAIAALTAGIIRVLLAFASNRYVFALGHDLAVALYARVLHQSYAWHLSRNTSEVIAAIQKVQTVTHSVLMPIMQATSGTLMGVFIVAALIAISPTVSLVAFVAFGLVYFGVTVFIRSRLRQVSVVLSQSEGQRIQAVQEGLGGIRDVLLDSSQEVFLKRFSRLDAGFRRAQSTSAFVGTAPRFVIEAAGMVLIAVLALVMSLNSGGLASALPVLGALALGAQRLLPLMQQVYLGWTRISANWHVLEDVLTMMGSPVPPAALPGPSLPFDREIAFRNVSFAYEPGQPPVLKNSDLVIQKGARVGIVGKTGSGKTTLVDLLMGLLEPISGRIEIDGRALDATTRRAWQQQIAHVPQSIFLADTTVSENIAFGVPKELINGVRLRESAKHADIADFIETLPKGYDTLVGERGVRLSGGQRQRIGIARALYKNAQLLVFDEATSALDNETEAAVMLSIERLAPELTIVIIAHRLTTVQRCTQLLSLDEVGAQNTSTAAPKV